MTLAELLVAMTLLGLLSLMMLGGIRFGARSWERTQESSDALNTMVGLQSFLRTHLGETARPNGVHGDAEHLTFTAVWMTALGGGGLYEFELSRQRGEEAADGGKLALSWRPAPGGDEANQLRDVAALTGERVMLEGIDALAIAYYGQPRGSADPEWFTEWAPEMGAPFLVRIEAELADPRQHWPPLIVGLPGRT